MKKKVLIPTQLNTVAAEVLTANGRYEVVQDDSGDVGALAAKHPDAYALIVRSEKVTSAIIDALPKLKLIVRAGAGHNTIDAKYARKRNVDVMTTPGANANAVAEEVVAMMLADARHVIQADSSCRAGAWEKTAFMGRELAGKTIGIIGLGNIGRLVARRFAGFEMKMIGYDPVISREKAEEMNIELTDLDTLFSTADYVTLHIPENDETKGMINEKYLSQMKKGATLVNCARAGILDEKALKKVRGEKGIRFLNDVYPQDEEGPKNVADLADIMLPHLGASTTEANTRAARRAAEEIIEYDQKGVTSFIVNRDIPVGLDETYCELANMLARLCRSLIGKDAKLRQIETSFYGSLEPFADWLLVPIVAALSEDVGASMDPKAARQYLAEMGIDYTNRPTDPTKGYLNSITVDMTASVDREALRHFSVRGTVAEGIVMVARINEFDKLYFEPKGHSVLFLYDDRPGVLGAIGVGLAAAGINIEDVRNPHDTKTNRSLAIMKVNNRVPDVVLSQIAAQIRAPAAFRIEI